MKISEQELNEFEEYFSRSDINWSEKGDSSESLVPRLIEYIRCLENQIEILKQGKN